MPITRKRQTFWVTSDNKAHDTSTAAREHEKRIVLCRLVGSAIDEGVASVVVALLQAPDITIIHHTPRKETPL